MPTERVELLSEIYRRGDRLRQRRARRRSGSALAVAVLLGGGLVVVDRDDDSTVATVDDPTRTGLSPSSSSATSQPQVANPSSTPSVAVTPTSTTTTTAATASAELDGDAPPVASSEDGAGEVPSDCRNSTDSRCGPFRYDYGGNQPATITITADKAFPRLGEEITFTFTYDEPDGENDRGACSVTNFDDPRPGAVVTSCSSVPLHDGQYGYWDRTAPVHSEHTATWTYEGPPGERTITQTMEEAGDCGGAEACKVAGELTIWLSP